MNCPHCDQVISKFSYTIHTRSCVLNPEMQALLRQWLPDPNYPGFIRVMIDYERNTPARPSREHVVSYYKSWQAVADAFGLKLMNFNDRRLAGKLTATGNELRRLSQELHHGRFAPSQNEYRVYAAQNDYTTGAMECDGLVQRYGSWKAVLDHFEMTLPLPARNKPKVDEPDLRYTTAPYWFSGLYSFNSDNVVYRPTTFAYADLD